jgi:purine-nucleoside phosphorylase
MPDAYAALEENARQRPPDLAVVLGSGLGGVADRVQAHQSVAFTDVPGLSESTVEGHAGRLILGDWAGRQALVFSGRIHAYEGHAAALVAAPIRLAHALGARRLVLTNAAGGIRADLAPGTLMAIRAHLDMTRAGFWRNGVTFAALCSDRLLQSVRDAAAVCGIELHEGRYGAVLGPNYETPAEIRALRSLGVDAVGMSTAAELEAAAEFNLECLAISCITNRAAGLSDARLTHEEVLATSRRQTGRVSELIEAILRSEPEAWARSESPPR